MLRVIGIDPGLAGGLGVLDVAERGASIVALHRTPTLELVRGRRRRRDYDVRAMLELLRRLASVDLGYPVQIAVEAQQAMPATLRGRGQGGSSTFKTGVGFGLWLALSAAVDVPYVVVPPVVWKRAVGLVGADKRASRLRAQECFPALGALRAVDEGPAEGLLLARYVASRERGAACQTGS